MKYTVIIPAVERSILDRCLSTMDKSVIENTIIYKNAPFIDVRHNVLSIVGDERNNGISTAWNVGRKHVIDNQQDYLIICSQNNEFHRGMTDFLGEVDRQRPIYGVWSSLGWHLIALARETLERVGEFDTNLYPAYYEDNEYAIRLHKLGMIDTFYRIPVDADVVSGYSTLIGIHVDPEPLKAYVARKWGETFNWMTYHEQKFFEHPYNNPVYDITQFERKTIDQLIDEYGYRNKIKDLYVNSVKDFV